MKEDFIFDSINDSSISETVIKESWYNDQGSYHRLDGPAIIYASGYQCWYIHGKYITNTESEFKDYLIQYNLESIL